MAEKMKTLVVQRLKRSDLLLAALVVIVVIAVGILLGLENNKVVPVNPSTSAHYMLEPNKSLSILSNWDGPNYLRIAQYGYGNTVNTDFFPLYPLLTHILDKVVRSYLYSALFISWVAFTLATYFYIKIFKDICGAKDNFEALRGVLFFVLFPTAIFLFATYTEALLACFSLGAIYFTLKNKYFVAGLLALLATATHLDGLFIVALVALMMIEQKQHLLKIAVTAFIGCLGLLSYMVYLSLRFHNALSFISAQKNHSWLNTGFSHLAGELATRSGLFLLLLIVTAIYWWKRKKSFSVYSFLFVCIVLFSGRDFSGFGRYTLMAFPVQIMLYEYFKNKKLGYTIAIAVSSTLWAYFLLQYVAGFTGG